MKSLVSFTVVACLWMIFALSSCATQDDMAAKPAAGAQAMAAPARMQMKIYFKEENNIVTIEKVTRTPRKDGKAGEDDVKKVETGNRTGTKLASDLVTYTKSPGCVALNIPGGGFYEICS
jgi:hypothetical protein